MATRQASTSGLTTSMLVILALGTFTVGTDAFILSGLLPDIARDLRVSESTAGQLTTAFAITYAVASPVLAGLTGAWDRKHLLAGGMILFTLGMVGQAVGTSFTVVAVSRVVAAIGAAAFQSNAYAVAGALASPERRGRALATVAAGMSVSTVLGMPLGVLAGQWLGWRVIMWLIAGAALIATALMLLIPSVRIPSASLRVRLSTAVQPAVAGVLLVTVLGMTAAFCLSTYVPLLTADAAPGALLVWVLAAFGVGQVLGNTASGTWTDRFGARRVRFISFAGAILATVLLNPATAALIPTAAIWLVFGACTGMLMVPQQHRLLAVAPQAPIVALGLNGSAIYLGGGIGSALGGAVLAGAGVSWIAPAAAVAAVSGLVAAYVTGRDARPVAAP